jgi:hypothetical protein
VRYARAVATALFEVNPALVRRTDFMAFWNGELPTVVYADAADQGLTLRVQTSDALANLAEWIPGIGAWAQEARDHVVSALRIESVSVPDYWTTAVADGIFTDPGLHMERLTGLVDQSYNGGDRRYTNTRPIVIDLALLCPPTQPGGCRLVAPQPPGVQLGS